jgi:hypothetical protein
MDCSKHLSMMGTVSNMMQINKNTDGKDSKKLENVSLEE